MNIIQDGLLITVVIFIIHVVNESYDDTQLGYRDHPQR